MHLNSQEIFELSKILNAECILLKDDEIIHPHSNDDFSVLVDIDTGIRIGLVEANGLEISPDLLIPHSWCLLQSIQTFDESADYVLTIHLISFRLLHIYLFLQIPC